MRNLGNLVVQSLCCNFLARPDFIAFCYEDRHLLSYQIATRLYRAPSMAWTVKSETAEQESRDFDDIIFEGYLPKRKGETA